MVVTDVLQGHLDSESILPTFTCLLKDKFKLRGLKDHGCQSNFITEEVAEKFHLKIIDNSVQLRIKGFNVEQGYCTKMVEVDIIFRQTR